MNRAVARPGGPQPHPSPRYPARSAPEQPAKLLPPHPNIFGSGLCLAGLALTALFLRGATPEDVARFGSIGALLSLGASALMDTKRGVQNVVRTDVMALMALYFLTLAEFLAPQPDYNFKAGMGSTHTAVLACLLAYGGIVVGRHFVPITWKHPCINLFQQRIPGSLLFGLFWICVVIGYLNMLLAVNFNFILMVGWFMEPRFYQPWQRGALGDWKAMLYETNMILYLIPPLGGVLVGSRRKYPKLRVFLVLLGVLFTFFYGFSSGTRNIFQTYLVTFLIGYVFAATRKQTVEIIVVAILCVGALLVSTKIMLDFRGIGLREYILSGEYKQASEVHRGQSLAVDKNLYAISRMVEYFPRHHEYLGLELPFLALVHPIPRVLWHDKPTAISISVEDIFGTTKETIATSAVGEEYMMHGYIAVLCMSLFFGAACAWWNLLALPNNSEFGILVYASGFFSVVITMRSILWFSTALLPTIFGIALSFLYRAYRRRLARTAPPRPLPRPPAPA